MTPVSECRSCGPVRRSSAGPSTSDRPRDAAPPWWPCSPSREQVDDMRILIVDDHALVRRGLNYVVKEGFPDADVVEAESSAVALEVLHGGAAFDLALVDVGRPGLEGLARWRAISSWSPGRSGVRTSRNARSKAAPPCRTSTV